MTTWTSRPTGDMTLSVLDERGRQILMIDMLRYGTMRAGSSGDLLARALNDLALIASLPSLVNLEGQTRLGVLPHPDAGLSPWPWSVDYTHEKRLLVVRDANGRKVAEKKYPVSFASQEIESIIATLRSGLAYLLAVGTVPG